MTNTSNGSGAAGNGATETEAAPQLRLLVQYVKDLSFENPHAPDTLAGAAQAPKINIGVDVQAKRRSDEDFEVDLKLSATANQEDDQVVFIAELVYGGVFKLLNIPDNQLQPVVLIECPRLLFPFARRILADATRDGGFPPLLVDPIDFAALFRQQVEAQQAKAAGQAEAPSQ